MMYKWRASLFTFLLVGALGLIFLTTGSAYAACPDGITNYWKLDEASGPTYVDFINGNDGMGAADPTAATGTVNGAQGFNGSSQGIDVEAASSFGWYSGESFSIECWVKRAAPPVSREVLVGRDGGAGNLHWWIGIEINGNASFYLRDTGGNEPTPAMIEGANVADGDWHHVVAVRDNSTSPGKNLLYVDGVLEASVDYDYLDGFDSTSIDLNIGYLNGTYRFGGVLDEVALYGRALTPAEITKHYTDGLAGKDYCLGSLPSDAPYPDDTISLWKLDESTPADPAGTYEDSFDDNDGTGNANPMAATGTVNGAQEFNGSSQGIDVEAASSFGWYSDESFSIECWVKRAAPPVSREVLVGRDGGAGNLHWWIGIEINGNASFYLRDTGGNEPTPAMIEGANVADGDWHHVVAVRDNSTSPGKNLLYVDGVLEASVDYDYLDGFDSTSIDLNIGYLNGTYRFGGVLDEVALYGRALNPAEISKHHTDGLAGKGIDYVPPVPPSDKDKKGGGGGGGGCFIATMAK